LLQQEPGAAPLPEEELAVHSRVKDDALAGERLAGGSEIERLGVRQDAVVVEEDGLQRRHFRARWMLRAFSAAGVTPGMAAASPSVAGRSRPSFWRISVERPSTTAKSRPAGMATA